MAATSGTIPPKGGRRKALAKIHDDALDYEIA